MTKVTQETATAVGQKSGGLMAALSASAAAAQEAHQKDVRDKLIELNSKTFSTAAAYDNAVMLGGYVAFFALWSGVQGNVSAVCRLLTVALMAISLMCYMGWQIIQMLTRQWYEWKCASILNAANDASRFNAAWLKAAREYEIANGRLFRFWPFLFVPAVALGFFAAGLLAYNALAIVLRWPQLTG